MIDRLFDLERRVVVLGGGCGLIGREVARALAARGARLLIADMAAARPEDVASELGEGISGMAIDVSDPKSVETLRDNAIRRFGRVDVLVNCHQYKPPGFLTAQAESFPDRLWDAIMDVNLRGTFLMCREFGREMLTRGKGSIINFASAYGIVSSNPDLYEGNSLGNPVAYSASKGGVVMLSKYLGTYWASRGVRVNSVTPHGVWNNHEKAFEDRFREKSPMKRMMQPVEIVGAIVFLASDASSYVTGTNIIVDGGWTAW